MKNDRYPLFRKSMAPWYDSEAVCTMVLMVMIAVMVFGIFGIRVARDNPAYYGYAWVPFALVLMCLYVILSTIIRLVKRFSQRPAKYK
jgi:hypothetical protein